MKTSAAKTNGGSSPRPWGTRESPASATCSRSVHPHARGEHHIGPIPRGQIFGSSPRPWGTHRQVEGEQGVERFIPTPVGNTLILPRSATSSPVHPHARGEHRWEEVSIDDAPRFIPTPVGNTRLTSSTSTPSNGSSPRPWGTQRRPGKLPRGDRFIPTPVGNTLEKRFADLSKFGSSPRPWGTRGQEGGGLSPMAVHPHARGEHIVLPLHLPGEPRFIPTPVGNT